MKRKNKMTIFLFLLFVSLSLIGILTGCGESQTPATPTPDNPTGSIPTDGPTNIPTDVPTEEPSPIIPEVNISTEIIGNVRVQLLSSTVVRIEDKGPKGFEDRPSYIVQNRTDWEKVEYELEENETEKILVTDAYKVHIPLNGTADDAYITGTDNTELWRYSDAGRTDTNVYLPSPSDELKSWYFTDSPRIIPSEYGYSDVEIVDALQGWDFDNDALDTFVFLPQGDYTQFCDDYTSLTGEAEMVTLQTLGYWDSRWYAYSSETALQQIKDYRDRGYSIDVMVIDTDWRKGASHGYEINDTLFPDMKKFLQDCEDLGIDICFNDHPEPVTPGNILDKEEVEYRNEQLTLVLSLGLDYWWYDRNWSVCLNPVDPDISVFAFGMYAYQWITQDYRESITDLNEFAERSLIMGNVDGCLHGKWNYASDISAHRYSIQWTGDIGADTTALSQEIYASVFGGSEVGLPYMSSDIGGHTQAVTDDMYVRWIQYGALSTICRVHCTTSEYIGQVGRMPWLFGETAEEVTKSYIGIRYRLLPLFYSLSRQNYDDGLPIMRRLDILYPEYPESSTNDQYLLGDYIIVAPIADASTNEAAPDAYFSHVKNGQQVAGLQAEYYTNDNWSGTPAITKVDNNIFYDWGHGGPAGMGNDNFSIKWSGNITIGNRPAVLSFFGDDTVKVYIDGELALDGTGKYDYYLNSEVLAANSTHSIEVWYAEFGYNAHVYMFYVEQPLEGESFVYNSRSVFIPEGTWIDVWSGQRYVGPYTYTVTHPLETSPIFVREGSIVALAPNMSNTREKDWSELVLDVYPSRNYSAQINLYEDDTRTVAYKDGKYRNTDITMTYNSDKKAVVITIGAAQGSFDGDLAFNTRTWNFRVHSNPGWSSISYVKINGKVVSITEIAKSTNGVPFAFEGASLDSDVATFSYTGDVYKEYVIEIYYDVTVDTDFNEDYYKVEIPFELDVETAGNGVSFSNDSLDWISYGESNAEKYTSLNNTVFEPSKSYDNPWISYDTYFDKVFADNSISRTSNASQKDFSFVINTVNEAAYYVIYVGGNRSTAKITVRDTAGNIRTKYIGNIDGSYLNRVVISCPTNTAGKLYVTYSMIASEPNGTGSYSSVNLVGAIANTTLPEKLEYPESTSQVSIASMRRIASGSSTNLSITGNEFNEDTLDWMHFGDDGGVKSVRRINGNIIEDVVFQAYQSFPDYAMKIAYNDGNEILAHSGSHKGTCTPGGITLTFSVTPEVKHIVLYTGAWNGSNTVEVYSRRGTLLAQTETFRAGDSAVPMKVVIAVNTTENDNLTVYIRSTNAASNGNVSLAAIAVTGQYNNVSTSASLNGEITELANPINLSNLGYVDWIHVGSNTEMNNSNIISNFNTSSWVVGFNDLDTTISYTDSINGEADGLTSGKAFDYANFNIKVDQSTKEIVIYATSWKAVVGIVILDSKGQSLINIEPFSSEDSDDMKSLEIRINITASTEENLNVIYYKGGVDDGNVGIAAIAVK